MIRHRISNELLESQRCRYPLEESLENSIQSLEREMNQAAKELAFEKAAELRDRIKRLKQRMVFES